MLVNKYAQVVKLFRASHVFCLRFAIVRVYCEVYTLLYFVPSRQNFFSVKYENSVKTFFCNILMEILFELRYFVCVRINHFSRSLDSSLHVCISNFLGIFLSMFCKLKFDQCECIFTLKLCKRLSERTSLVGSLQRHCNGYSSIVYKKVKSPLSGKNDQLSLVTSSKALKFESCVKNQQFPGLGQNFNQFLPPC